MIAEMRYSVQWVLNHNTDPFNSLDASTLNVDLSRVALVGSSAGANPSAVLAGPLSKQWCSREGPAAECAGAVPTRRIFRVKTNLGVMTSAFYGLLIGQETREVWDGSTLRSCFTSGLEEAAVEKNPRVLCNTLTRGTDLYVPHLRLGADSLLSLLLADLNGLPPERAYSSNGDTLLGLAGA